MGYFGAFADCAIAGKPSGLEVQTAPRALRSHLEMAPHASASGSILHQGEQVVPLEPAPAVEVGELYQDCQSRQLAANLFD